MRSLHVKPKAKEATKLIAENAIIALLYMAVGKLSLLHTFLDSNIGTVWPAAGIALAVILLRGYRILGGLFIGVVLVTYPFESPKMLALSLAAAAANCLGPLATVFLIDKTIGDRERLFTHIRNLALLLGVCLPIGSFLNASLLTISFYVFGFLSSDVLRAAFLTFWVSNFQGFLIIGSLLLIWSRRPQFEVHSREIIEGTILVTLLVVISVFVFQSSYPFSYAPIIFMIWAAIRFYTHGAILAATIVSGIAVTLTSAGYGPFIVERAGTILLNDSLLLLQLYIGFVSTSALLLAATVIERNEVQVVQAQMAGELNAAHDIQMSMVPLTFPPFPDRKEFDVYATLRPAKEVGGDFYEYFFINDNLFCFCIGDVAGKGIPAALFMAMTRTHVNSNAGDGSSAARIVERVNNAMSQNNDNAMFVTIFLGILDVTTGNVMYTNAGHNPPYIRRKDGLLQRLDDRHGPVIGAISDTRYKEATEVLSPGDLLFIYTDGVTEAMNSHRALFTEERLKAHLNKLQNQNAKSAVEDVVAAVKEFEDIEQTDDLTVLALEFREKLT